MAINTKSLIAVAALGIFSAQAGVKKAAKDFGSKTYIAGYKLVGAVKGDANLAKDAAWAVLDKQGNLVQVLLTGPTAQKLYRASVEASLGSGEDVAKYAFGTTEYAVAITGGAADYAVDATFGAVSEIAGAIPYAGGSIVYLTSNVQALTNNITGYVKENANAVVGLGKDIGANAFGVLRGITNLSPEQAANAVGGLLKNVTVDALSTVWNAFTGIFKWRG